LNPGDDSSARNRPWPLAQAAVPVAIVAILVATAGFVGWFGFTDLFEGLSYVWRFTGAVFVAIAVALVVSSVAVLDHWFKRIFKFSGLVALIGTCVAFAMNATLLITALNDGERNVYIVYWAVLLVGSVLAAFAVYRTRLTVFGTARITVALGVSAVIAVANFGYTQLYLPYSRSANTMLQAGFGTPVLSKTQDMVALPVDVKITNRGDVGLYILAAEYMVLGRKATLSPAGRAQPKWWRSDASEGHAITRNTAVDGYDILQKDRWYGDFGHSIESGQEYSTSQIVEFPAQVPYDELLVKATVVTARKDRLTLDRDYGRAKNFSWSGSDHPKPRSVAKKEYVEYQGRIHENNAIAEHIRRPRYLTIWWIINGAIGGNPFVTAIARKGEEGRNLSPAEGRRNENRYGLVTEQTGWQEKPLWALVPPHS
jgi:hypothetical protein